MRDRISYVELVSSLGNESMAVEALHACLDLGFGDTPLELYRWAIERSVSLTQPHRHKQAARILADHIAELALTGHHWVSLPGD